MKKDLLYRELQTLSGCEKGVLQAIARYKLRFHPNLEEEDFIGLLALSILEGARTPREVSRKLNRYLQKNQTYLKHYGRSLDEKEGGRRDD